MTSSTGNTARMIIGAFVLALLCAPGLAAMQTTMLLKATVTDRSSGKPAGVQYTIEGSDGKIIKGKTRDKDGSLQAILTPGTNYTITFQDFNILKSSDTIMIRDRGEYYEDTREFTVQLLKAGQQIMSDNVFESGKASFSNAGKKILDDLVEMVSQNRPLYVTVIAGVDKKEGKTSGSLVDERVKALEAYFQDAGRRVSRRVSVTGGKSEQSHNLIVAVEKVKDPFD